MKCFGDKGRLLSCKIILLDEQELTQEIPEETYGQGLLDMAFQHLNLLETSYFGLRYIDQYHQNHWLDPKKKIVKQLKGSMPFAFYFSVKFYTADPTKLVEELTRYQFFLQIKQDILQGRLSVPLELVVELGALAVQSELGDYDPRRHLSGYISEFRFTSCQSAEVENKISDFHKSYVGQVPAKAELNFLEKVKWLDMYGVDLHPVLGEDNTEYFLGLTPTGIIVLRNKDKVGNYFWPRITKIYFRGLFFMLRVKDKSSTENTYGFETPSKSACKHLWKCCVEHHAFFRLTQAAGNTPQAIFSLGSKFRYSGRTEKEVQRDAELNGRPKVEFSRSPSRRYKSKEAEGTSNDDTPIKTEIRTVVTLPSNVSPSSQQVYRSTSLTLSPRSVSPHSTRSAPFHSADRRNIPQILDSTDTSLHIRQSRPASRSLSPRSAKSSLASTYSGSHFIGLRTPSAESQSSIDSRSCYRRQGRSRCKSSDGDSEVSSKCSSRGHRRHKHRRRRRLHSDDSSDQKHHRRRHRHRSTDKNDSLIESSMQWAKVQAGETPAKGNQATVRILSSGYSPVKTNYENGDHCKRHRNNRSSSPAESKKRMPEEIRQHIDFDLRNPVGLSESQLKEIPYTEVNTAKTAKLGHSRTPRRKKSPRRRQSPHFVQNEQVKNCAWTKPPMFAQDSGSHKGCYPSHAESPESGIDQFYLHSATNNNSGVKNYNEEMSHGFVGSYNSSYSNQKRTSNNPNEETRSVLKPQPSPQSSVTSGISVGSSSVSIPAPDCATRDVEPSQVDKKMLNNLFQEQSMTCQFNNSMLPAPFYMNTKFHDTNKKHVKNLRSPLNKANSLLYTENLEQDDFANFARLTPISDIDNLSSNGNKIPTPLPRSSIGTPVSSSVSFSNIFESCGPSYANGEVLDHIKSYNASTLPRKLTNETHQSDKNRYEACSESRFSTLPKYANFTKNRQLDINRETLSNDPSNIRHPINHTPGRPLLKPVQIQRANDKITYDRQYNTIASKFRGYTSGNAVGQNEISHWKVSNWNNDRFNHNWSNNGKFPSDKLSYQGRKQPTSNHRSGNAGSLELILGPLIQSAMQHQRR